VQDLNIALSDFESQYDSHLRNVRGLSGSTRSLHRHVVHRVFALRFPAGRITRNELRFHDFVQFLTQEFARLHSRETQRAWLTILRSLLRYVADEGYLPRGSEPLFDGQPLDVHSEGESANRFYLLTKSHARLFYMTEEGDKNLLVCLGRERFSEWRAHIKAFFVSGMLRQSSSVKTTTRFLSLFRAHYFVPPPVVCYRSYPRR